jgi:hypothetical protein
VLLVPLLETLDEDAVVERAQLRLGQLSHGAGASLFQVVNGSGEGV